MLTTPGLDGEFQKTSRYAVHSYTDRLWEPVSFDSSNDNDPGRASSTFPGILYFILLHSEGNGTSDIISWQPHGRSFIIHNQKEMVNQVLTKYFNQSKYSSFQRQLNVYGFTKLANGLDRGGYYHEYFLRGRPDLLTKIKRQGVKGTGTRQIPVHETEPNFYLLPHCSEVSKDTDTRPNDTSATAMTPARAMSTPMASGEVANVSLSSLFELAPVVLGQPRREENLDSVVGNDFPEPRRFATDGRIADNGVPDGRGYFRVDRYWGARGY